MIFIKVRPVNASQQEFLVNQLIHSQTGTVDQNKKVIAAGSTLLNNVNCSNANSCHSIGREKCLKTPNTCGPCLSGYY